MKFLEGFGFGWWSSGLLFWVLVFMIDLPISCSYKTLAIIFLTIEAIIFCVGFGVWVYSMWRFKK